MTSRQQAPGREVEWAAQIERNNPQWLVVFGDFSREYVAFPLFRVPPGLVITDTNPAVLAARLPRVQERYGISPMVGETW